MPPTISIQARLSSTPIKTHPIEQKPLQNIGTQTSRTLAFCFARHLLEHKLSLPSRRFFDKYNPAMQTSASPRSVTGTGMSPRAFCQELLSASQARFHTYQVQCTGPICCNSVALPQCSSRAPRRQTNSIPYADGLAYPRMPQSYALRTWLPSHRSSP